MHQQHSEKSFLRSGVEITRSIPIASFTLRTIVPIQQSHAQETAGTYSFELPQSSYQAARSNHETHPQHQSQSQPAYKTAPSAPVLAPVVHGYAALGPAISSTYSTDAQQTYSAPSAPQRKTERVQNIGTFNYAGPIASPNLAPAVASSLPYSVGAHQPHQPDSFNFAPVIPAQQRYSASATPSIEYLPPASAYWPRTYSTPTSPVRQTHDTPAPVALSYSTHSQQSFSASASAPVQDNYSVPTPQVANKYLPPASAPLPQLVPAETPYQLPALPPQVSTQTFHPAAESGNYNAPFEQSYYASDSHYSNEYLPPPLAPVAQTFTINQQTGLSNSVNEKVESKYGGAILNQTALQSSSGYEGDSTPVIQPVPGLEQQSYREQQSDENFGTGNYEAAAPLQKKSATHIPAQQNYPAPTLPLQQSYSSPRQQSYSTPAQLTFTVPAPTSQPSYFSSTSVGQEYSSASPGPAASHHSGPGQNPHTTSVPAHEAYSAPSSASISQEYLPPAPQKQPYGRPAEEPINKQSNSAPATAEIPVKSSYPEPEQAPVSQQSNSLVPSNRKYLPPVSQQSYSAPAPAPLPSPVQISQEYLNPAPVKQSHPKPTQTTVSQQSYSAPASALSSTTLSYSTPHAQTLTVNQKYLPPALAARNYMTPGPTPAPAPVQQSNHSGAAASSDYQSSSNGQTQLALHEVAAPQNYFSAPALATHTSTNFQSAADISSQETGTVYGSNGGYVYRKNK